MMGFEPMQEPPRQAPLCVQRLPSSQGVRSARLVCVQPVAGSQPSAVQLLLSLQSGAGPPTQLPLEPVSDVVQALPSSQEAVVLVCLKAVAGAQVAAGRSWLLVAAERGSPGAMAGAVAAVCRRASVAVVAGRRGEAGDGAVAGAVAGGGGRAGVAVIAGGGGRGEGAVGVAAASRLAVGRAEIAL